MESDIFNKLAKREEVWQIFYKNGREVAKKVAFRKKLIPNFLAILSIKLI